MDSTLKISGIIEESIVDGEGIRFVVFVQGCPHHCAGCHNPDTHDFSGGKTAAVRDLFDRICENPLLRGVTFSGGEPFCQSAPLAALAALIHGRGLDVTTYTGFTLEELQKRGDPTVKALLDATDILIDGPFDLAQRDLSLRFRGSANQRVIDMNATRRTGALTIASI